MGGNKPQTFQIVLERRAVGLQFVMARLDGMALRKAWPEWKNRRVMGTMNGYAFRSTLFPAQKGALLFLVVNREMQAGAHVKAGNTVKLRLEPDMDALYAIPVELERALKQDKAVARWFAKLPLSMQKGFGNRVAAAKGAAVRRQRAERVMESMMLAMDGELETPPILRAGFQREPLAHAGWKAMTPVQRRNHLVGIFYVQTVGGREKRAAMAIEQAVRVAKRLREQG
ncbi:MAG TPA: YdeI/OmpD-associated family protein [Terracidiphilus sp.]|nr:YdeI/OmpD-associated family protein [Terracidiphilus sp.]